jgi:diacylglycerol kinase (ATP)
LSETALLIIYNPAAQGGKSHLKLEAFILFLKQNEIFFTLYETNNSSDATNLLKKFSLHKYWAISIIGGDGTLNLTLNCLPKLDIPIHLIPAGSGNDFSKMLYDADDNETAIFQKILDPKNTAYYDLWSCNGRKFINVFGVGFDGALAKAMQGKNYWLPTKLKYWTEIIAHIFWYKNNQILLNGAITSSFMLCAANGRVFGRDFNIAPTANAQDGWLEVVNIKKVNLLQRLRYLPAVQKGKHLGLNVVATSQQKAIDIEADHIMTAQLDGEPIEANKFVIKHEGKIPFLSRIQSLTLNDN